MFQRTIIRAEVYPHEFGSKDIQRVEGGAPKFPKGAGVEFQFALFKSSTPKELEDASNISSVALRIRSGGTSGTILMDSASVGAVVEINPSLSLADWNAGTSWHIRVKFPSSLTAVTAGASHHLCLYGITTEDPSEFDVFGTCTVEIVEVGTLGAATPPVPADEYATLAQVGALINQLMAQYVKKVGDPGESITITGADQSAVELYVEEGLLKNRNA